MTTINTFEDILEAMERNPALRDAMRRHILTEELLQLPARVSRLEELVSELASKLAELTETFTRFVEQTNLALAQLSADVSELKTDVSGLKADVSRLETNVAGLKTDVSGLKTDVSRLETNVSRLERGQNRMSGQLNNLIGSDYERRAARVVLRRLKWHLNIDQSEILRSSTVLGNPDVTNLLNRVVDAGIVSNDEAEDLELADIIIRGQDAGGATVHVVVEVSVTIHEEDIERASRRAAVLERAAGGTIHAVVIGESASPASLEMAEQEKVTVFQVTGL